MGYYGRTYMALSDGEQTQLETERAAEAPCYTPYSHTAPLTERLVLSIPFRTKTASRCRTAAKVCGARFDPQTKEWYLPAGKTNEGAAVAALNRFRLIAPAAGAVPRSSASAKPTFCAAPGSAHSNFSTANDGFAAMFPNGWMIALSTGNDNHQTPCKDAQTLHCAIWTGTEWMLFESTGKRTRTVTPAEYVSVLAWVASQTAVAGATPAPLAV